MIAPDLAHAREALRNLDPGMPREEWVRAAMACKAAGLDLVDFDTWSQGGASYDKRSVRDTWRSIKQNGGIGPGTLFAMAKQAGWRDTEHHNGTHHPRMARPTSPKKLDPAQIWERCEPASASDPYITKKQGIPEGLRVVPADDGLTIAGQRVAGWLVVPAFSLSGELRTLQFIPPPGEGKKVNLPSAAFDDGMFVVGELADSSHIYLIEGISQCWACWQATGKAAVCCFGAGRMRTVAELLHKAHPHHRLILVPDRGKESQAAEIARAVGGAWVELPAALPDNADVNDYALEHGADELEAMLSRARTPAPAFPMPAPITEEELNGARLTPDCVVENLLYMDVALLPAPGGTGKTTLLLYIAVHVVLGRELFGERVLKPGTVLVLTAEDAREWLVARLARIMCELDLDDAERKAVMNGVRIKDLTGTGLRLTAVIGDVVQPHPVVDDIIGTAKDLKPVLVIIDPAVSFGVGELRVNDAEQGLIEAARKLRNALNACVLYVHHTGKAVAREKIADQYAGRGGSAFADGARMVHVLHTLTDVEWQLETGFPLAEHEIGMILSRAKLSYCPPRPPILIKRTGYKFERIEPASTSRAAITESRANQVWQLLSGELKAGRRHTKNSLEQADAGNLTRAQIRAALAWLEASGRVEIRKLPDAGQRGPRSYLHPVASPDDDGEPSAETAE